MEDEEGVDDPEALCALWEHKDKSHAYNSMSNQTDDPEHRAHYQASGAHVELRAVDDQSEDGLMSIRMPIASTGEVRNEGDDPLSRDELSGMARQINDADVGVFLSHGQSNEITDSRFGQTERLGNWREAEIQTREDAEDDDEPLGRQDEDEALLFATAEMPDPATLPDGVGRYRESLGILKEQAERGIGMSASIGWRDADDAPGGNDLMEASIVGIPADPRTVTQDAPAAAVARAAVDAGADPEALVSAVRDAVMGTPDATAGDGTPDTEPRMSNEPESDAEQASDTDEEQPEERQEVGEELAALRELLEEMNDTLGSVADAVREGDEDDEDDDDEDEDDDEMSADATDEADTEPEAEQADEEPDEATEQAAAEVAELRDALDTLRDGGVSVEDVEIPEPDDEQDADAEAPADAPDEDPAKVLVK